MPNIHTESILSKSITFERSLDDTLQTITGLYDKIEAIPPHKLREKDRYNKFSNMIEGKLNEFNEAITDLNSAITSINSSITKINNFHNILIKMQGILNIGNMGTLEGITREHLATGKFPIGKLSKAKQDIVNEVFKQPYDEKKTLKSYYDSLKKLKLSGGFSKSRTTKKHRFH